MSILYDMTVADDEDIVCSELMCVRCGFRWIAVRRPGLPLKKIECPHCEKKGFVLETGEDLESFLDDEDDNADTGRQSSLN